MEATKNGSRTAAERERLTQTLEHAIDALRSLQHADGHWCAELEGDSILESEYLLMKFILGQERQPLADDRSPDALRKIANELRARQREGGTWAQYPGAAPGVEGMDLSATVKGYFALKLMGDDPDAPHMRLAREAILEAGGAERCNSFTKFYLAALGQISWNAVPSIPPELVYLPRWFYFHLRKLSAWTRTMIVPLSIVTTLRPTRQLPEERGISELYRSEKRRHRLTNESESKGFWNTFFTRADGVLKLMHRFGGTPIRRLALKRMHKWMLERAGQDGEACTDGLGAIFPPMVYLQIALHAMGEKRDHPVLQRAERELDAFFIEQGDCIRIQPCFSPVWDTGIATYALTDCGLTVADDAVCRACDWLRDKECRHRGDWTTNLQQHVPASGWWFEYHNAWYPDCDDTAMVAMALYRAGGSENREAAARGIRWVLAMQNDDGGWAAFDKGAQGRSILEAVPFADHNAMQDPSCPDITGRVLECLAWHGYSLDDEPVRRAVRFIQSRQRPDGSFFGRWGVNYIYGTWQAIVGPIRCGVPPEDPRNDYWIQRAGEWLKSVQQPDGSFGESPDSYIDESRKGIGPATASQTAWGAMTMQAIFGRDDPDVQRAIQWLAETQLSATEAEDRQRNPDGDPPGFWAEPWFTGTGFPRVFYLRYHLYRLYFPIMAIGRYLQAHGSTSPAAAPAKHETPSVTMKMKPKLRAEIQ